MKYKELKIKEIEKEFSSSYSIPLDSVLKIIKSLPKEEEQDAVIREAIRYRLTENEIDERLDDIKRSRERGIEPNVEYRLIIKGQWIFDTLKNPIKRISTFNPKAFSDLDDVQKNTMVNLLVGLKTKVEQLLVELGGITEIEVDMVE